MAESFRRVVGDQATLGYRQLPSIGSEGPDLKTLVYAGLGVALGILVGTVMADGSWRQLNLLAQHPSVQSSPIAQASPTNSETAKPAAAKALQTPPVQAQPTQARSTTKGSPQSSAVPQAPSLQASVDSKVPAVHAQSTTKGSLQSSPAPQTPAIHASINSKVAPDSKVPSVHAASVTPTAPLLRNASGTHNSLGSRRVPNIVNQSSAHKASNARSVPGTRRVSAAHRHRPVHGLAGWKKHLGHHKALKRHRLRAPKRAAVSGFPPAIDPALKPVSTDAPFIFTVEGELTVSAYDALTGTIETYEGEAFALHHAAIANGGIHGEGFSPNIHYKCNRFGSCTLVAGQFVLDAQRTK